MAVWLCTGTTFASRKWSEFCLPNGGVYYHNLVTGQTVWERPVDFHEIANAPVDLCDDSPDNSDNDDGGGWESDGDYDATLYSNPLARRLLLQSLEDETDEKAGPATPADHNFTLCERCRGPEHADKVQCGTLFFVWRGSRGET